MAEAITPEQLLGEASWLRRLAARLADDRDDADDLTQEAWIAAWQRQPDAERPLRPWLAKVVRDAAKMRRRADGRRIARETAAAIADTAATPEELLAQARLHQLLVELVLALDEPYRGTVLARYVDGRTATDIARTSGVPEGTVRWRLSEALHRLRTQLDARARKRAWWPVVGARALQASTTTKAVVGAAIAIALLIALLMFAPGTGNGGAGRGFRPSPIDAPIGPVSAGGPRRAGGGAEPGPTWLTPADGSTSEIAGRVIDDDGAPIASATVQLQSWPSGADEARVVTGTDGTFSFTPRWAATYVVVASVEDRVPAELHIDSRAPRDATDPKQLVLVLSDCTQAAEGTITDAGGGPIAGATIRLIDMHLVGPFGPSATSGTDGHYSICLPRGTSWLDIGADGYEHISRTVAAHDGRLRVDVALAPGASVTGRVVDAVSGESITGAWVGMFPTQRRSGEASDRRSFTNADGRFTIDGLGLDRYMLTVRDGDHIKAVIEEVDVVAVRGADPLTIRMQRGVEVRGAVQAAGAPVAHAQVQLAVPGTNWGGANPDPLAVVTDAGGAFTFRGVPPSATLTPSVTNYLVHAPTVVNASVPVTNLVIEVGAQPVVHGHVFRDGRPIFDAEVSAAGAAPVRTDVSGAFALVGLVAGSHKIWATSERAGAFSTKPVTITAPTEADVVLELDGGGTITGTVRNEAGAAVVGAEVFALDSGTGDQGTSTTAIDGGFAIDSLAGGAYTLRVRGYPGAPTPLAWADREPAPVAVADGHAHAGPIALVVKRSERPITGTVVDHDNQPVADAIVRLGPVWGWTTGVPIARTDTDGRFRLVAIGDGPFALDAGIGGGPLAAMDNIQPGATDVVLRLIRPGTIIGTLVGLPEARIWARRTGGIGGAASVLGKNRTTVAGGDRFAFAGLAPGHYTLLAVTSTTTASGEVQVREADTVAITLSAGGTRTITGRVTVFGTHKPVPADDCTAVPATGDIRPAGIAGSLPQTATSAADGTFTIANAPAGDALVLCFAIRGFSTGATVVAITDDTAAIEIVAVPPQTPGWFEFSLNATRLHAAVDVVDDDDLARSGVARDDRVIAVDGANVESLYQEAVYWLIAGRPFGSTARITFDHAGTRVDRTVTVGSPTLQ